MSSISYSFPSKQRPHVSFLLFACALLTIIFITFQHSRHIPANRHPISTVPIPDRFNPYIADPSITNSWDHVAHRRKYRELNESMLPAKPPPADHDVCLIIGGDPSSWQVFRRNSRSLCVTSPLCIPVNDRQSILHTSIMSETACRLVTPEYDALPPPFDDPWRHEPDLWPCHKLQHRLELCPWPSSTGTLPQPCVPYEPASDLNFSRTVKFATDRQSVYEGVTIVVPRYPFTSNIFHFAASIAFVTHAAANIHTIIDHFGENRLTPPDSMTRYPLSILFMTQRRANLPWQDSLERVLTRGRIAHILPKGLRMSYLTNTSSSYVCVRNPVLMGQRSHVNAWPFPNVTEIALDGTAVPRASIEFRSDVYSALHIEPAPISPIGKDGVRHIPPPPLVVAYARRPGREANIGMGVHAAGTVRRFSEDDEQWFVEMLRVETQAANVELQVFTGTAEDSFDLQVKRMEKVGFVVGIHGANLANCIFMRPFGALFEIFPANAYSTCYVAGANSGLAYFVHFAKVEASPDESGCSAKEIRCHVLKRQRLVKISTEEDREGIRENIRRGIQHLVDMNLRYPQGVPVEFDRLSGTYQISNNN